MDMCLTETLSKLSAVLAATSKRLAECEARNAGLLNRAQCAEDDFAVMEQRLSIQALEIERLRRLAQESAAKMLRYKSISDAQAAIIRNDCISRNEDTYSAKNTSTMDDGQSFRRPHKNEAACATPYHDGLCATASDSNKR